MKSSTSNNPSKLNTRKRVQVKFSENSGRTKQYFKEECNINNIINKFQSSGQIPNINQQEIRYDFAPNIEFKTALDLVKELNQEFQNLDAEKQQIFGGDPRNYSDFLQQYQQSPESFSNSFEEATDTSVSKPKADAAKVPIKSTDEGS